jgi:hypothetical protein
VRGVEYVPGLELARRYREGCYVGVVDQSTGRLRTTTTTNTTISMIDGFQAFLLDCLQGALIAWTSARALREGSVEPDRASEPAR